jgi:tRNA-dihydrouridine synthase C
VGNPIKQWLVYLRAYYPQAASLFEKIKRLRDSEAIGNGLRNEMLVQGRRLDAA